jgi:hypothetical protein
LSSTTFKQALIAIGTFGVIASAIFNYVYLSTSSHVRGRTDRAIMTAYVSLRDAYQRSGRDGAIELIRQKVADKGLADNLYILADPSLAVLAVKRMATRGRGRQGMDGMRNSQNDSGECT